jgi:hypothetical protein
MAQVQGDPSKDCCTGYWVSDRMCEGRVYDCRSGQANVSTSSERKSRFSSVEGEVVETKASSMFQDKRYYIGIAVGILSVLVYQKYLNK